MVIIHIVKKGGEWFTERKEAMTSQYKIERSIPKLSEIISSNVGCVVFKLPSLLGEKNIRKRIHLVLLALITFCTFKYYKFRYPFYLNKVLNEAQFNDLFFVGSDIGRDIIRFHYLRNEKNSLVFSDVEVRNFIAKNSFLLNLIGKFCKIRRGDFKIKVFNLFSRSFLIFLLDKFPDASFEVRYYDVIGSKHEKKMQDLKPFFSQNKIKVSRYDRLMKGDLVVPYVINQVNSRRLLSLNLKKTIDISFIGILSKNRLAFLENFLSAVKPLDLNIYLQIPKYGQSEFLGVKVYNEVLSYEDYLKVLLSSKATIDVWRLQEDEGYSFRVSESMVCAIKLITNRSLLLSESFYDPSRILVISHPSDFKLDQLENFLNSPFKEVDIREFSLLDEKV